MSLIDGIGDEVTHFFIALLIVVTVTIAWWTTNIRDHWHIRTVYLLDRRLRRYRNQRRLTNHTEATTISESSVSPDINRTEELVQDVVLNEPTPVAERSKPSQACSSVQSNEVENRNEPTVTEEQSEIIRTMDADSSVLRQRRLTFYDVQNLPEEQNIVAANAEAELSSGRPNLSQNKNTETQTIEPNICIKLKYINDDLKLVDGKLEELLGDFKRRHFNEELSRNKLVRLIFNGQMLERDNVTLKNCGFFNNCVVHCLIHQRRTNSLEGERNYRSENLNHHSNLGRLGQNNNGNNNRDWDLGNILIALVSFTLGSAWYFRYQYPHMFTVTATVALFTVTGIFTVVSVGMYFPDPDPTPREELHS